MGAAGCNKDPQTRQYYGLLWSKHQKSIRQSLLEGKSGPTVLQGKGILQLRPRQLFEVPSRLAPSQHWITKLHFIRN